MAIDPSIPLAARGLTFNLGELLTQATQRRDIEAQIAERDAQAKSRAAQAKRQQDLDVANQRIETITGAARQVLTDPTPESHAAAESVLQPMGLSLGPFDPVESPKKAKALLLSTVPHAEFVKGLMAEDEDARKQKNALELKNTPQAVAPKAPEPFTLGEGQQRFGPDGTLIASGTPKPEPKETNPNEAALAMAAARGDVSARRALDLMNSYKNRAEGNAKFWVVRDGKPLRVSESEYRPGDLPANTREQGRPVTSGDAGRLADFDTSVNDLATLRGVIAPRDPKTGALIEPGSTGTLAGIGASLPNWATNAIGWTGPKQKQATIERVKQVIGKALEGGVLRKEDEDKYKKILPTIEDPVDVVETKLDGLNKAIAQRKQTTLDNLADAGYDVGKFVARENAPKAAPKVGSRVTLKNGQTVTVKRINSDGTFEY